MLNKNECRRRYVIKEIDDFGKSELEILSSGQRIIVRGVLDGTCGISKVELHFLDSDTFINTIRAFVEDYEHS